MRRLIGWTPGGIVLGPSSGQPEAVAVPGVDGPGVTWSRPGGDPGTVGATGPGHGRPGPPDSGLA
jgi:hypothetical protein